MFNCIVSSGNVKFYDFTHDVLDDINFLDVTSIDARALGNADLVLPMIIRGYWEGAELVGLNPTRDDRNPGNFKINARTGLWSDFATGDSGLGVISLMAYVKSVTYIEAAKMVEHLLDHHNLHGTAEVIKQSVFEVITPVPIDAPKPTIPRSLGKYGSPFSYYPYNDFRGNICFYAVRFHNEFGKKTAVLPFSYGRYPGCLAEWRFKMPPAPRPLFLLDELTSRPDAIGIIVEGERTALAARKLFPDYFATTSVGGANAAHNTDWSPLRGRRVIVWPDNDEAGVKYANNVVRLVTQAGALSVKVVDLPNHLPKGWDLADSDDIDIDDIDEPRMSS